jgi:hypothetical protein
LEQDPRLNIVEDFEVVDKLCALLSVVEAWQYKGIKELLDSEVALEVCSIECVEVVVEALRVTGLCKAKILVICELAEVLDNYVFEVV